MVLSRFVGTSIVFLLISSSCDKSIAAETQCADWVAFKDEKCFKILDDTLRTYADAEKDCEKLENSPTLVIIHSREEQEFLTNYLFKSAKKIENFWIGAKYSTNSKYKWLDESNFSFTNWDVKAPKNKSDYCVQMEAEDGLQGKWIDEPCGKKNLVVCQRMQNWSIARLQKTLLDARKELKDSIEAVSKSNADLKRTLDETNVKMADLRQTIVPMGFLYTQFPSEKSPAEIWPWLKWTDVSSAYAGSFFRAVGGGAAAFGQVQAENSPHLSTVEYIDGQTAAKINLASGQCSRVSTAGFRGEWCSLQFCMSSGEIRPRNMAVNIWKRSG